MKWMMMLQQNFNRFSQDFLMVIGYIVVIIISNFYTLFVLVIMLPFLYYITKLYRPASRDLKRLTQITLTPIITQFNETLVGLDTIRAYKLDKFFLNKVVKKTNDNHKTFLAEQMALRWFSIENRFSNCCIYICCCIQCYNVKGPISDCFIVIICCLWIWINDYVTMGSNSIS